jgi:hypothetical protein
LRGKNFRLLANAEKIGRKLKRRHSIKGVKGTIRDLENFLKLPDPALYDSDGDLIEPIQQE